MIYDDGDGHKPVHGKIFIHRQTHNANKKIQLSESLIKLIIPISQLFPFVIIVLLLLCGPISNLIRPLVC